MTSKVIVSFGYLGRDVTATVLTTCGKLPPNLGARPHCQLFTGRDATVTDVATVRFASIPSHNFPPMSRRPSVILHAC